MPLAPVAPIYLAAGPFVGSSIPGGARFNITARSPQTRILGDANAGGRFATELRFAGVDQLRIRGRAAHLTYLFIDGDRVELRDARALQGRDVLQTSEAIQEELGSAGIRVAAIGPAAENGVLFAGLFADGVRAAARTGMGTVLASKNLKAIAVRGDRRPHAVDPPRLRTWAREINERLRGHPEFAIRHRLGSTQLVSKLQAIGALPTRHFQAGTFAEADRVSGEAIAETYKTENEGCFSCPVRCSRRLHVSDPRYPGFAMEGPEYEPLAGFTARVGVSDLPLALHAVDRCNRLGLDAISTSEVISWAMELTQRGLLTRDEAQGLDLRFGHGEAVLALIEAIAMRQGFGDVLADGVRAAADRLGRGRELAMHVKGLELFQADVRAMKGYALGNAVASRGADHLRSEPWFEFSGDEDLARERYGDPRVADRLAWNGKGRLVAHFEEMAAVCDALGMCKNLYNNMMVLDWDETAEILAAILGGRWSGADVQRVGERIVNLERALNGTWGITRRDDTLPERFLREAAGPAGSSSAGTVVELPQMLEEYYLARGWDRETGLPPAEKLRALGLEGSD
jgi:aldehyde:ferredoxin oxidoreductase